MWVMTYTVNDPYQHGDYLQECWIGAVPDVTYLASYIKYFGLTGLTESWEIRNLAQRLYDGETVKMLRGRYYRIWEKPHVGAIPLY